MIDYSDCGTVYVFWLLNYIYNLLNFLKPRTFPVSTVSSYVWIAKNIYIYSRRILSKQSPIPKQEKVEGHLISGYHSQEMSASKWSGKAGIQCLHEYPIFHFLF